MNGQRIDKTLPKIKCSACKSDKITPIKQSAYSIEIVCQKCNKRTVCGEKIAEKSNKDVLVQEYGQ